ncbi:nucleoside-diphosphate sugar epimerase [Winogradskyella maritima]|uniref:Nucleoside-diphosphate sugar epimerase n=1 Tax=Winogradskyella maritima TaxID=1517766 RepID=A0ABV8AE28_9FLAO|nr:nucleoside-diphosphate sugar epimerase [Winogradskyella maritima]
MGKTAIILGSTGLTGGILLEKLLEDVRYSEIKVFNRNSVGKSHPRLKEYIVDLIQFDTFAPNFKADEVFCCIGTTLKKTPDKELYRRIDYGIPVEAAKTAKANIVSKFLVMSSMGANPNSSVFYNKTKGEMERDVLAQNIENTYVLQPSLIGGKRDEKRTGEYIGKLFMSIINPLLFGPLKKYQSIKPETIANAMLFLANSEEPSGRYESDQLKTFGN